MRDTASGLKKPNDNRRIVTDGGEDLPRNPFSSPGRPTLSEEASKRAEQAAADRLSDAASIAVGPENITTPTVLEARLTESERDRVLEALDEIIPKERRAEANSDLKSSSDRAGELQAARRRLEQAEPIDDDEDGDNADESDGSDDDDDSSPRSIVTDGGIVVESTDDTQSVTDDYQQRVRERAAEAREAESQPVGALLFELEAALHSLSRTYHTGGQLGECYDALEEIAALQMRLWWAFNDGDLNNPAIDSEEGFADD